MAKRCFFCKKIATGLYNDKRVCKFHLCRCRAGEDCFIHHKFNGEQKRKTFLELLTKRS
jgi:hypothetical protein